MIYFKDINGEVYGYDPEDQQDLIDVAIAAGWEDVSASWPLAPIAINPLIMEAAQALMRSDTSVMRILAAGVVVPANFLTYRAELRAIVNGSDTASTALPAAPTNFPLNT